MARLALQLSCYNGSRYLPYLLTSLRAQTFQDWMLYVTDNASKPEEADALRSAIAEFGDRAVYVDVGLKNVDFVGAHNILFAAHQAPYVQLLNDDAFLEPNYLERLVAALDANAQLASVSGRIYRWDFDHAATAHGGRTQIIDSLGLTLSGMGQVDDRNSGVPAAGSPVGRSTPEGKPEQNIEEVFGVSGGLPMYRRSAVLATSPDGHLFDPSFVSYKEDVELAWRLQRAHFTSAVVHDAIAFHRRTFSVQSRAGQTWRTLSHSYRNHLWTLMYHLGAGNTPARVWAVIPYEMAKALYWLLMRPAVFFAAWRDTWLRRRVLSKRRRWYAQHLSYSRQQPLLTSPSGEGEELRTIPRYDVAVVIVCHNDLNAACLDSLQRARTASGLNVGVVIVDNNSTAIEAPKVAWDSIPDAIVVQRNFDAGYGSSMNRGAREIDAEYVFVLNPDTVLIDEGIFTKLVAFMRAHPEAGIAAPKLMYPDGRLQETVRRFPDWKLPFFQRSGLGKTPKGKKYTRLFLMQDYDHAATRMVDWAQGSAMFLPMKLWRELDGFDDRFWMYFEDVDLCRRSWAAHRPVYYVPEVTLQHAFGKLSGNKGGFIHSVLVNKMARAHLISFAKYLNKWGLHA